MVQLREQIWANFRHYHDMPVHTPKIDGFLDTLNSQDEKVNILLDLCAMKVVSYLNHDGKDLTPEQQVEAIEPIIKDTVNSIVRICEERGWRPIV